jgi:tRNA(Arg) A34 adenosine deaminase TadA
MKACKRMRVEAWGIDRDGKIAFATNGNETECKDIKGACGCIHAEVRLLQKMRYPVKVLLSHSPCVTCAVALYMADVEEVYYINEYRLKDGINILKSKGVKVVSVDEVDLFRD